MKFCYLDESGTGDEPYAVMVGIIVDAQRMHITKGDWKSLLETLSKISGRTIKEFHTRDFYSGNSPWRSLNGELRTKIIEAILKWLKDRKHKITFTGVDKAKYYNDRKDIKDSHHIKSLWCMLALHQILTIQKYHQPEKKNKGNTVLIFDNEDRERTNFAQLINNPPDFTDLYYDKKTKEKKLNQIIDVPYFGNSEEVHLIQIADFIAYILRRFVELNEGSGQRYKDEKNKISKWTNLIVKNSLPRATRFPAKGRDECSELFYNYAPESIRTLG